MLTDILRFRCSVGRVLVADPNVPALYWEDAPNAPLGAVVVRILREAHHDRRPPPDVWAAMEAAYAYLAAA